MQPTPGQGPFEGAAMGADPSEREDDGMAKPHGNGAVQAARHCRALS